MKCLMLFMIVLSFISFANGTDCVMHTNYSFGCFVRVGFEECRRQKEALICPLCRAEWKSEAGLVADMENGLSSSGLAFS